MATKQQVDFSNIESCDLFFSIEPCGITLKDYYTVIPRLMRDLRCKHNPQ